jgi:hypothetical protein
MSRRIVSLVPSMLFIFYCTAVGVYLVLRPWSPVRSAALPSSGFLRGFVSGLGLVHLAAGIADLRSLSREFETPVEGA